MHSLLFSTCTPSQTSYDAGILVFGSGAISDNTFDTASTMPPLPPPPPFAFSGGGATSPRTRPQQAPQALPMTMEEQSSQLEPAGPPTWNPSLGEAIWVPAMQHAPLAATWSGLMADQRNNTERRIAQDIITASGAPACSDLTLSVRSVHACMNAPQTVLPLFLCLSAFASHPANAKRTARPQAPDQQLNVSARASSQFLAPMLWTDPSALEAPQRITGFAFVTFSWDTVFRSAVPSFVERIDVVLSSPRATFTLRIDSGEVESVGWGAPQQ